MATINSTTLDQRKCAAFMKKTKDGGLRHMGFELVSIDFDFQAYELVSEGLDSNMRERRGVFTAPVIMGRELPLPRATRGQDQDQTGVFEYHGI